MGLHKESATAGEHRVSLVHSQSVKLEAVGGVSVRDLALEVRGQVDDGNRTEGALLRADTATDTEGLGNKGQSRFGGHFDTWGSS